MSVSGLVYDPLAVFVGVFSDPRIAADVAHVLTCNEVNVLVGLLEAHHRPDAAGLWLTHHLRDCDEPPRHQH